MMNTTTMKKVTGHAILLAVIGFAGTVYAADWPANVAEAKGEKGKSTTTSGKLESGALMDDLTWAATSSMACFPATQNERFRGNHVLYHSSLPTRSVMTITLIPKDPNVDMSLYAYTIGTTSTNVPPKVSSAVSCEADYKWDRPKKGKTQDHTRSVKLTAITNPYNVVIGVAGAKGVTAGDYDLKVDIQ
jgi:hypothetical protein